MIEVDFSLWRTLSFWGARCNENVLFDPLQTSTEFGGGLVPKYVNNLIDDVWQLFCSTEGEMDFSQAKTIPERFAYSDGVQPLWYELSMPGSRTVIF